jgi:quercetin dioxygenase-like cupin family protein
MTKHKAQISNKQIKAIAVTLADLLDYQKDSVVSREIVKKDAGTVTLFAFDKGQGLSEHTAPFDAIVHILDGRAQVNISGKPYIVKKGQIIILPANKPHSLKAVAKFKMLLIMIKAR